MPQHHRPGRKVRECGLASALEVAAASYQQSQVIPHCPECSNSCCRLDVQVLELSWKQVKVIWGVKESRAAFDQRLASGQGPEEIRAAHGLYYAHRRPCPAYDESTQSCRVYQQGIKPAGCTDYPVYVDGDRLVADLRCEAVRLENLKAKIAEILGPGYRIAASADREFPFLVSISVRFLDGELKKRRLPRRG